MNIQISIYAVLFVGLLCLVWYLHRKHRPRPATDHITINLQGMVKITRAAITATPLRKEDKVIKVVFPYDLEGFIANLKPSEINTILIESATGEYTLHKRDIARVVTISAAIYGFKIPLRLVCLDARTHALYNVLMMDMTMTKIRIIEEGEVSTFSHLMRRPHCMEPEAHYIKKMNYVGHLLMHYAMQNYYPSFKNFVATFQKNLKTPDRHYTQYEIQSLCTGYAAITGIPLPNAYINYSSLAEQLLNSTRTDKIEPVKLRLIKS